MEYDVRVGRTYIDEPYRSGSFFYNKVKKGTKKNTGNELAMAISLCLYYSPNTRTAKQLPFF